MEKPKNKRPAEKKKVVFTTKTSVNVKVPSMSTAMLRCMY